ncbi:hypothetical protein KEM52_000851 [Ascosphaera acerosa]|nr:hypothetical protein KEM52_000851 [Ascosphaera acerosa]
MSAATEAVPPREVSPLMQRIIDYATMRMSENCEGIKYYNACHRSLCDQLRDKKISQTTYNTEMDTIDQSTTDTMLEYSILDKQFRLVTQDMEDDVLGMQAIGTPAAGEAELVEKAYFQVIREAKRTTVLWQQRYVSDDLESRPDRERSDLDGRVLRYYDAVRDMHGQRQAHCSLTGWHPEAEVGVAGLVPGCIAPEQIAFFFGSDYINLVNGKNCIPLQKNLAEAVGCGVITFIPLPPSEGDQGPNWTCILVDDGFRDRVFAIDSDGKRLTYRDIHGSPLTFHNHHRPARRFLFFHFVISYLRAQTLEFPVKPNIAWPVPGRYVDRLSLLMLGESISGRDLPELLYRGMVFEILMRPPDFSDVALCLAMRGWVRKTREAAGAGIGCLDTQSVPDGDLSTSGMVTSSRSEMAAKPAEEEVVADRFDDIDLNADPAHEGDTRERESERACTGSTGQVQSKTDGSTGKKAKHSSGRKKKKTATTSSESN